MSLGVIALLAAAGVLTQTDLRGDRRTDPGANGTVSVSAPTVGEVEGEPSIRPILRDPRRAPPPARAARPPLQLGLDFVAYWRPEVFLDDCFHNDIQFAGNLQDGKRVAGDEVLLAGIVNPETLELTGLGDFREIAACVFGWGSRYEPAAYGGDWIVDWEGEADIFPQLCGHRITRRSKNRIEIDVAIEAGQNTCYLWARNIGPGFRNLRAYRKADADLVASGQVFSPRFLAEARRYDVIRDMNWQAANVNRLRRVADMRVASARRLSGAGDSFALTPVKAFGMPLEVMFRLARETETELWTTAPPFLGLSDALTAILPTGKDWRKEQADFRALGKSEARSMIASREWDLWADRLVAAMIAENYPQERMLHVELGNEIWNFAGPFYVATSLYWGMGETLAPGRDQAWRQAYGQVSARLAEAVDGALRRAGRTQNWTIVLAGQHVWTVPTQNALDGFGDYFRAKGVDPAQWYARAGVSTASYYGGALEPGGAFDFPDDASFNDRLLNEIKRDPDAARARVVAWTVDVAIPSMIRQRADQRAVAEKFGARFIGDYEGESHETGTRIQKDPAGVNFLESLRYGPAAAILTRAWADALAKDDPDAMIANFVGSTFGDPQGDAPDDREISGPWDDDSRGGVNHRLRGLEPYLRPKR